MVLLRNLTTASPLKETHSCPAKRHFPSSLGFPSGSVVKNLPANAGDMGLIPGSGRSPGGGHGNPLQYSGLENPMDRRAWRATVHRVAKSQTQQKRLNACACMLLSEVVSSWSPGGIQAKPGHSPSGLLQGRNIFPGKGAVGPSNPPAPPQIPPSTKILGLGPGPEP